MFAPHCPACDRPVLLGVDRIVHLGSRARTHEVTLRCRCGTEVRWRLSSRVAADALTSR
jgi:RNase P subunit RPR2